MDLIFRDQKYGPTSCFASYACELVVTVGVKRLLGNVFGLRNTNITDSFGTSMPLRLILRMVQDKGIFAVEKSIHESGEEQKCASSVIQPGNLSCASYRTYGKQILLSEIRSPTYI